MGYYTTNTKLDGSFRSISVRVKRPGLTVRARKGYRGFTSAELSRGGTAPSAPESAATVTAAVAPVVSFSARAQFRIRAAAWSRPAASGTAGAFWVVGEIDQQTKRQAAWSGSAQVDVAVIAADGAQVATRRLDLRPADGAFTVEFPDAPGAAAGDYTVRIRLRSPVDGELALSDTVRVSVKDGTPLGDAVMWRRGPSTGPQHLRTANPRFRRNERIRLELATSSAEPATARLIDRSGQPMTVPVEVTERPDPSGAFRWVVADLALAPFGPADYAIEVTQGPSKQLTAFRVVP